MYRRATGINKQITVYTKSCIQYNELSDQFDYDFLEIEMSTEFPSEIGACIDALYELRAQRLDAQKLVDESKALEKQYEDYILNTFTKMELNGAKGSVATAGISKTTAYQIADWVLFTKYVSDNNAWELMRKQPTSGACAERFANGIEIPGIVALQVIKLTLNKAGI